MIGSSLAVVHTACSASKHGQMTRDRRQTRREKCDEANKAIILVVYLRVIRLARVSFIANRWPQGISALGAVNGNHSVRKGSDPYSRCRAEPLREILSFARIILRLDSIYFQVLCDQTPGDMAAERKELRVKSRKQ